MPEELTDFEVMREMHWSWETLQRTPSYVRRYAQDFTFARREAENSANERAQRKAAK